MEVSRGSGASTATASSSASAPDAGALRRRAADYIRLHADDFAPFLPYEPGDGFPEGADPPRPAVLRAVEHYCARLAGTATDCGVFV